ncbi:flavoprotein [Nocardiopsis sp. L17-MgMaSL7]|uniref:flavoprotein n=1 Tax=Nocardiopsis sp. L17-MgMaSL7 TaxID=1938893 RepID=UPI000D7121D9|nr:flavoprotein [Nocardiopsis sp. L17-MgMaSL7]PWV48520.1 flavoprotein [Nocardiopsis sp. L17-MgMaSL7]
MTSGTQAETDTLPLRLLVGVSGSIAALTLPAYLYAFRAVGVERIAAVLTRTAEGLVSEQSMRAVCDGVYTEADHGRGHVALGRWADQVVVLPCTAHVLGCAAQGLAPSLLTSVLLAAERPVTYVPAMNPVMWGKSAVQRNVARLREDGNEVVEPRPCTAYEVASKALVPSLAPPPPEELLRHLASAVDGRGTE